MSALLLSRAKVLVHGKVQGVYYRESTKLKARSLGGLTGAAYNLPDKTQVEVIVEGPKSAIEELVAWCWKGPEGAAEVGIKDRLTKKRNVTKVEVTWEFEDQEGRSREFETFENGGKKP